MGSSNASVVIATCDLDGCILNWSERPAQGSGYSPAELLGRPLSGLIPGFVPHATLLEGGEAQARLLSKSGEALAVRVSRQLVLDGARRPQALCCVLELATWEQPPVERSPAAFVEGGPDASGESPLRMRGAHTDVTSVMEANRRSFAAHQEQESQSRLRAIADELPQLVWTCTPEGHCDFVSQRWLQFTGERQDPLLGTGWLAYVHPEDRPSLKTAWAQSLRTGQSFKLDFRIRRHDGVYRWFDTRGLPLRDGEGRVLRWFGSNTEIHEARELRQELQQSLALYRAIAEQLPKGVLGVVGPD